MLPEILPFFRRIPLEFHLDAVPYPYVSYHTITDLSTASSEGKMAV